MLQSLEVQPFRHGDAPIPGRRRSSRLRERKAYFDRFERHRHSVISRTLQQPQFFQARHIGVNVRVVAPGGFCKRINAARAGAPVSIGGRLLVDGNLSAPVPVITARRLGARRVIAVDVSFPPEQADLSDPYDALYQGFSILTRKRALAERAGADLAIEPNLPEHNDMSATTQKSLIRAGERTGLAALPRLRELFRT